MTSFLKRYLPAVTVADFHTYSHQSVADIQAYADFSEVLYHAVRRMFELFGGDKDVKEIRIPFIITQTERKK